MSALPPKADMRQRIGSDVCLVPLADVAHLATLLVAIVHRETSAPQRASRVAQGLTARPLR